MTDPEFTVVETVDPDRESCGCIVGPGCLAAILIVVILTLLLGDCGGP